MPNKQKDIDKLINIGIYNEISFIITPYVPTRDKPMIFNIIDVYDKSPLDFVIYTFFI